MLAHSLDLLLVSLIWLSLTHRPLPAQREPSVNFFHTSCFVYENRCLNFTVLLKVVGSYGSQLSHARSVIIICSVLLRSIVLVLIKFLHEVLCQNAGGSYSGGEIVKVILSLIVGHVCCSDVIKSDLFFPPLWRWSACCQMRKFRLGCAHYSFLFLHFL